MSGEVHVLELNQLEYGTVIRCVNDKRTQMITDHQSTEPVDLLLLKLIDAPTKKERKGRWRGEVR